MPVQQRILSFFSRFRPTLRQTASLVIAIFCSIWTLVFVPYIYEGPFLDGDVFYIRQDVVTFQNGDISPGIDYDLIYQENYAILGTLLIAFVAFRRSSIKAHLIVLIIILLLDLLIYGDCVHNNDAFSFVSFFLIHVITFSAFTGILIDIGLRKFLSRKLWSR